jgi:hypothetical protein
MSVKIGAGKQRWAEGGAQRTGTYNRAAKPTSTYSTIMYMVTLSPNIRPPPASITRDVYIVYSTHLEQDHIMTSGSST